MKQFEQISEKNTKTRDLVLSLLLDAVGMMSFSIPFIGEFADVVWAPISGFIMVWMYKGSIGKVAGVVSFLEEILPATDIIPSFTIMWFYTYIFKKN
jgi:hypothetical protein